MKTLIFKEKYYSPTNQTSSEDANYVLEEIRKAHPDSSGWEESEGYVEQVGEYWRAVRKHSKYSY